MTYSVTETYTYSITDIETVMRRFAADLLMVAQSSAAITEAESRDYAHDIEMLACRDYLQSVDLTLFSGTTEVCATQYRADTSTGNLTMSRPGGVLWPRVSNPYLRIVLRHTDTYDTLAQAAMKSKLRINWTPTNADTSHDCLIQSGGRSYASNGWGLQRRDYVA